MYKGILNVFLAIADKQLSGQSFIAGNDFTLADIQFGHCLYRYFEIDIKRADFPNLNRYYKELTGREMYKKHVMVSFEELREFD